MKELGEQAYDHFFQAQALLSLLRSATWELCNQSTEPGHCRKLGDLETSAGVIYDLLDKGQEALSEMNDWLRRTGEGSGREEKAQT